MPTTFYELHSRLRAEIGDYFPVPLAKQYIRYAMREIADRHQWSWLLQLGEIVVPEVLQGDITVVKGSQQIVVDSTLATAINALPAYEPPIGRRQVKIGVPGGNVFEIRGWDGVDTLDINFRYPSADGTYSSRIIQAYYLPPLLEQPVGTDPIESSNFKGYLCVRDKSNNFPLILDKPQEWLDKRDPRRDATGTATHFCQMPPTTTVFPGAAVGGTTGIPPGTMRHELWPAPTGTYIYDCLYQLAYWPLTDNTTSLIPETLSPEFVIQTALVKACSWALRQKVGGLVNRAQANIMAASISQATLERDRLYLEAYREDQAYYESRTKDLLGGKFPWVMGAAYAQVHDINLMAGLFNDY